jgi:predicted DNA-binding transcriptional regulator AlpA
MSQNTEADMTTHSTKLRVPEAARYIGLAQSTLNKMRCFGGGPRFAKAGARVIVYDRRDLDEWLEARTCNSTSEYQQRKLQES